LEEVVVVEAGVRSKELEAGDETRSDDEARGPLGIGVRDKDDNGDNDIDKDWLSIEVSFRFEESEETEKGNMGADEAGRKKGIEGVP
jgi:hypothetical protein